MKLLHVYTDGQPGDACPKKSGQPLRLGDGQCAGESRCRHYQGMGPFVTIKCAYPEAQCVHVGPQPPQRPAQTRPPQPVQESTTPGEPARGPILRAWQTLKKQYPDVILLLRLGDFYEAFEEDARVMAEICDVVLTSRMLGKRRVAMAGVPAYAIERYVADLLKAGHRVGLCEQIKGDAVEVMPTETLDEIYRRTAERQHAPDGMMTKIKARWAGLNPPPSAQAELAMPVEAPVSTSEPAPTESAPTQLSLF